MKLKTDQDIIYGNICLPFYYSSEHDHFKLRRLGCGVGQLMVIQSLGSALNCRQRQGIVSRDAITEEEPADMFDSVLCMENQIYICLVMRI